MPAVRPFLITAIALGFITAMSTTVAADDDIPEVFDYTFKNVDPIKIYAGPVTFNHAGHVKTHGLSCHDCHHTVAPQETVVEEHCRDCHGEPGFIRGKKAEQLGQDELIEHYLNALHAQCIACHRQKKIANRKRKIPVGCTQCHNRANLPAPE